MLKRPGEERSVILVKGQVFKVGDVIETKPGSTTQMTLTDDSFMNVGPESAVRVNRYTYDPEKDRRTAIIRLIKGKSRFVVYKLRSSGSLFWVEAGNALVASAGFADFVVLASRGRTEVVALDQGLTVKNSLPYVIGDMRVLANQRSIIQEKYAPTPPVTLTLRERKALLKDLKQD